MRRLLINFRFSYLQVLSEVQGRRLRRKVRIPTTALCPGIHPHTARCFCSPLAGLGRPTELTAVLCTHIYLSFKQRGTQKSSLAAWGQTSLNQMPSKRCYTCLTCLVNATSKLPVFHCDLSLDPLPDILCFCHYHVWLRLKQTINKMWPKIHHSKHCLFKASSLQSSSEQTLNLLLLEALASEPALSSKILCADNIYLFS